MKLFWAIVCVCVITMGLLVFIAFQVRAEEPPNPPPVPKVSYTLELSAGWNLVSVPLDGVELGGLLGYEKGYLPVEVPVRGEGYWLWSDGTDIEIEGYPDYGTFIFELPRGWHLIGSPYEYAVDPASIGITGYVYGWDGSRYDFANTLEPYKGYWVWIP